MDENVYLCEELVDRVRRQEIPVYQAMLDLDQLRSIIPREIVTMYRRLLYTILAERVERDERDRVDD
jgi:hypothetical protein